MAVFVREFRTVKVFVEFEDFWGDLFWICDFKIIFYQGTYADDFFGVSFSQDHKNVFLYVEYVEFFPPPLSILLDLMKGPCALWIYISCREFCRKCII